VSGHWASQPERFDRPGFRQSGLTLLESMIVLSVIALLVLISVPGVPVATDYFRLSTTAGRLASGLEMAATESLRRSSSVWLCPSSDGQNCREDGDWNSGWIVFSDGNGNHKADEIELLKAFSPPHPSVRIISSGAVRASATLTAAGLTPVGDETRGEFQICIEDSRLSPRRVTVHPDGWVQISPDPEFGRCT
jgi:type IV fimbrial biogenesis protein FimT